MRIQIQNPKSPKASEDPSPVTSFLGHWTLGSYWSSGIGHWGFYHKTEGFTMVELVMVMAIITVISAMVLVSFTGLHEGAAINRSARELALATRMAQNMSLAVSEVNTQIPPAVGVKLTSGSRLYVLFADLVHNNTYGAGDARIGEEKIFEGGVKVKSITYFDVSSHTAGIAHIMFAPPEATATLTDESGNPLGDILEIQLASASGKLTRTVTVRTSGQISIK